MHSLLSDHSSAMHIPSPPCSAGAEFHSDPFLLPDHNAHDRAHPPFPRLRRLKGKAASQYKLRTDSVPRCFRHSLQGKPAGFRSGGRPHRRHACLQPEAAESGIRILPESSSASSSSASPPTSETAATGSLSERMQVLQRFPRTSSD